MIEGRLFIVGCARSGTTLLQSFLAAHPAVRSFPETAVFGRLLASGPLRSARADRLRRESGAARPERTDTVASRIRVAYERAATLLDRLGHPELQRLLPQGGESTHEFARAFVGVLDRLALEHGKRWWVEKTPGNIGVVREISQAAPEAKFINILRDGRQNVASLYGMALEYSDVRWWAKFRDLDDAIETWNGCLRRTRDLLLVPEVMLVRYERLISDTEAVMRDICAFAGLAFSREMMDRRVEAALTIVLNVEPWKAGVLAPVRPAVENRFDELFDAEQKAYIEARLERIDF